VALAHPLAHGDNFGFQVQGVARCTHHGVPYRIESGL
jgi:hypothetical protein